MVCTSIYHYLIFYRQYEQSIEIILHTWGRRRISSLKIVLFHVHTTHIFHSSFLSLSLLFLPSFTLYTKIMNMLNILYRKVTPFAHLICSCWKRIIQRDIVWVTVVLIYAPDWAVGWEIAICCFLMRSQFPVCLVMWV